MTDKLKTLMAEQADSVDFAMPDLDTMTRDGDRRVRRRRGLAVVGGVAATAVLGGLLATQLGGGDRATDPGVVTSPSTGPAPLTYVTRSTLNSGEDTFDLGSEARAYVRTAAGYVYSDPTGVVWSWIDGERTEVGRTDARSPHLVSDDETAQAGWLDDSGSYAVLDQSTGSVETWPAPAGADADDFGALDAGAAYWRGADGPTVVDLASDEATPVSIPEGSRLGDLEDGLVAVSTDGGTEIRDLGGELLHRLDGFGSLGSFSPDARYFTSDADEPQVWDVATGEPVVFDLGGRQFGTGYEWLGPRTLAMIAADKPQDSAVAVLLSCAVPAGSCEQVAELGTFQQLVQTLALPTGTRIDD
jgi:hypothetical protein